MSGNLVEHARSFATAAHAGQRRKYTEEPYINHCAEVVKLLESVGADDETKAAGWLHDTVEDCGVDLQRINLNFGARVTRFVWFLTNVPHAAGSREARHRMNVQRLAEAGPEAQTVKLADLIDNTKSIVERDPGFAVLYLKEKRELLEVLTKGHPDLLHQAWQMARQA